MTSGSSLFNLPPWGRKLYGDSFSRVMFWTFEVLALVLIINRPLWSHFVFILAQMSVAATSLLGDSYHHFNYCIYRLFYFCYLIEDVFIVSLLSLQNVYYYDYVYVLSFHSRINTDQWYYINLLFDCFSAHVPNEVRV